MNNYYFTADKWYGPLPDDYLVTMQVAFKPPSGDSKIPQFAGMVKEENKDFKWKYEIRSYSTELGEHWQECGINLFPYYNKMGAARKTAVPVAEEGKQMFSEEQVTELLEWMLDTGCENGVIVWIHYGNMKKSNQIIAEYLKTVK